MDGERGTKGRAAVTYTVDSPIIGKPTGTLAEALAWLDIKAGAETEYATELWRLCTLVGIDPALLFAQAAHETADFSSAWWQYRRNPAGIGITGDAEQNAASHIWKNGIEAARAQVVHMFAYAEVTPEHVASAKSIIEPIVNIDPRWDAVFDAGYAGEVSTLADLTGKWATDPRYAEKIAAKANSIFQDSRIQNTEVSPVSITTGRVPYPDVIQSHLPASNPYVVEGGAPKIPEAIIWHRMLGSWGGTNNWFHGGNAATAYGVAVAATDGAATAGKIYEWIAPKNGWYGESSGPAREPYGDGLIYVEEVGVAAVNCRSKAIEISGNYDTPLDQKARESIAAMTAYWADQRGIPWTEFPHYKAKGRSFVIWHNEITGLDYKACPGAVVMAETDALIGLTRQIMKRYQEDAVIVPETIKPAPINWKPGDVGIVQYHGEPVYTLLAEVTCSRATLPRVAASTKKGKNSYGPNIEPGSKCKVVGTLNSPWYFWDKGDGTFPRISRSAFYPALPRPRDAS